MRATGVVMTALAAALVLPAAAKDSPAPVADPAGLLLPLPVCGAPAGAEAGLLLRARGEAHPAARATRRRPSQAGRRPSPAPAQAEPPAATWHAFFACPAGAPGEAEVTAGAGVLRRT